MDTKQSTTVADTEKTATQATGDDVANVTATEKSNAADASVGQSAIKERLEKAKSKERKAIYSKLGIESDEQLEAVTKTLAQMRATEAANGNGHADVLKERDALKAERDELLAHFDAEWESVGDELKKVDAEMFEHVESLKISPREKTRLAQAAVKKLTAYAAKKPKDTPSAIAPSAEKKMPEGMIPWFKERFPIRASKGEIPDAEDIKKFCREKGMDAKQFLS